MLKIEKSKTTPHIGLVSVNILSFLAQIVQVGAIPTFLSLLLSERSYSPEVIGWIAAAPWLTILLAARFVPWFIRKFGLIACVFAGLVLTAIALVGVAFAQSVMWFFICSFALGLGLILRWIACDSWIIFLASAQSRGRAIGLHETLMGFGIALGPLVIAATGIDGGLPFGACFALLSLSMCTLWFLRGLDRKKDQQPASSNLRTALLLVVAIFGAFVCGFIETSVISLMPVYSTVSGYSVSGAAMMVAMFGFGGTVLQFPLGWAADHIGCKTSQILCACAIVIGGILIPFVMHSFLLVAAVLFLWGGAVGGMNTLAILDAGQRIPGAQITFALTAVATSYTLASIAGPVVSGSMMTGLSEHGIMISAVFVGVVFLLSMACFSLFKISRP